MQQPPPPSSATSTAGDLHHRSSPAVAHLLPPPTSCFRPTPFPPSPQPVVVAAEPTTAVPCRSQPPSSPAATSTSTFTIQPSPAFRLYFTSISTVAAMDDAAMDDGRPPRLIRHRTTTEILKLPFTVLARVGRVAYRLELPEVLGQIHDTFHVSQLRKCLADESAHVPLDDIQVDESLNYAEKPVAVIERKVKQLRNKEIWIVKVQWQHRKGSEWTWEPEAEMRERYPELFSE
ncbi:hypothetical protein OSB04_014853 [Centaurea solstitialis]|uniref:Tf2-1-like SH3-like domain-containing protein n=1 Tax=Centaurea solstitialis TaxID=347529 RepID=A0AA38THS8_9ASTR|nr:hypothetical protein OSB04_014853 [Centaurea solstitialis]